MVSISLVDIPVALASSGFQFCFCQFLKLAFSCFFSGSKKALKKNNQRAVLLLKLQRNEVTRRALRISAKGGIEALFFKLY
jgi:hypothetical protein